ncbi:universal stress protein [Yunchengibacter salinarum]|uniref:universal stress protein n=1 Tax=Yunchengibacter salinarum TaxID=3133399 RepID=UPI0035B61155
MTEPDQTGDIHPPLQPVPKRVRKIVAVVDGSPESRVAIRFAAARASHITGGELVLFHCIRPGEFQHWMAVANRMREEAWEEADIMLRDEAEKLESRYSVQPELVIREGDPREELLKYLGEAPDIFGLALGAGTEGDPGPLVDYFTHHNIAQMPCPIFIIPGTMSVEDVDAMA